MSEQIVEQRRPGGGAPGRAVTVALVLLALAAAWEGAKAAFAIPDLQLPHTYEVVAELFRRTGRGELWLVALGRNALVTAGEAAAGFALGAAAGFVLAVVFTHSRLLEQGMLPYVVASQTVPILAIAPAVVVWLGASWASKAVIAAYLTFFPVTVNALRGLRSVDPDALDLMRSFAASGRRIFWTLRVPHALPYLFVALRISATASVIGAIIGELPVGSAAGMGVVIINAAQYYTFRPLNLWASLLVASALGLAFYGAVALAERLVVTWRPPDVDS